MSLMLNLRTFRVFRIIDGKLKSGHEQSVELKKNIVYSLGIKLASMVLGIIYLPTILSYVDKSLLGIVLTIDSIVTWLYLSDIGLGNGLKNKFTEALVKNDKERAKSLVSTAYFSLFSIITVVFIIALVVSSYIDWNSLLKVDYETNELVKTVQYILFTFMLSFGLRLINSLIQANQKNYLNGVINLITKASKLFLIFLAIKLTTPSLFKFVLIDHTIPMIILFVFSLIMFNTGFKEYRPSIKRFRKKEIVSITSLGFKFFWVQIAAMVLFSTDNIIISQLFTTSDVTVYNIIRQYYYQVWFIFTFISIPLWSAYTKAYVREDFDWIKRITIKVLKISVLLSALILIMLAIYQPVIRIWLRGKIEVPIQLAIFMAVSQIIMLITSPFVNFINGAGKLRITIWLASVLAILNIPLSILFAKPLGMGTAGVIFATCVCNGMSMIISAIQYYKIVYQKSEGIWIR